MAFGFGVVVVVGDLLSWAGDNVHFLGDTTPSTGRENLRDDVLALTWQLACIAAIGVVLGLWWRRRLAVGLFGIGAVVALVAGLTVYAVAAEDEPDRPAWQDSPHVCQEYSGDGNRCPGD